MPPSHPADWLFHKYGRKPGSVIPIIKMARKTTFPDGDVGIAYRDRMCSRVALIDFLQKTADPEKIQDLFRRDFSPEDVSDIRTFLVYLNFLAMPDQTWPCEIRFDHARGEPIIGDLDAAWDRAEQLVLGFLALHALARQPPE
jgi:hypothetical protein